MIDVTFSDDTDSRITSAKMLEIPRVGEYIWLLPADKRHSSYMVTSVAHWVSDAKHFQKDGYHHACVYVEKVGKQPLEDKERGE